MHILILHGTPTELLHLFLSHKHDVVGLLIANDEHQDTEARSAEKLIHLLSLHEGNRVIKNIMELVPLYLQKEVEFPMLRHTKTTEPHYRSIERQSKYRKNRVPRRTFFGKR